MKTAGIHYVINPFFKIFHKKRKHKDKETAKKWIKPPITYSTPSTVDIATSTHHNIWVRFFSLFFSMLRVFIYMILSSSCLDCSVTCCFSLSTVAQAFSHISEIPQWKIILLDQDLFNLSILSSPLPVIAKLLQGCSSFLNLHSTHSQIQHLLCTTFLGNVRHH